MNRLPCLAVVSLLGLSALAQKTSVTSPDGKNAIVIDTEPVLTYSVLREGVVYVKPTPIALETAEHGVLGGAGLSYKEQKKPLKGKVSAPVYKKREVDLAANVARLTFKDWSVDVIARNDGVAYRFVTAFKDGELTVNREQTGLTVDAATSLCYGLHGPKPPQDVFQAGWEMIYKNGTVSDIPGNRSRLVILPLTATYKNGVMCMTESDLRSYAGLNLGREGEDRERLTAWMANEPTPDGAGEYDRWRPVRKRQPYLAKVAGSRSFPWRVFALAGEPADLMASDIVWALATPNQLKDVSWIKPGKVSWDWWNAWNINDRDFRGGINMETYRDFIDFASANGLEYVILDEGWSKHLNLDEINPDLDLQALIDYGKSKNVGLILWAAWSKLWNRQEELMARFAKMGVKGLKIDFMDRDDKEVEIYLEETARVAAKHHLLIDYHGMHKPTGMSRMYPNIVNYEGVYGLEQLKGGPNGDFPRNDCQIPFTRMVAGPMDYTPGAMLNRARSLERNGWKRPGSMGTRAHQMALFTLFEAPLQMLCDSPSLYRRNQECADFLAKVPTVWDDTIGLAGEIGKYAAVARRKGNDWWIGAITDWDERKIDIPLAFLGGGEWERESIEDDVDVDVFAEHYVRKNIRRKASDTLHLRLRTGGGWTARLKRVK